jgi:NitT/TauT family transport system substrate-binding protein
MKAILLAMSLLSSFSLSVAYAQLTKMTVGYGAISAPQLPAWVAKESGIFQKNGLDVQLVFFKGSTTAVMALLSRETPFGHMTGPPVVTSALRGSDAVVIAGGTVIQEYWLMSRPEIKTAEQLKGGTVAVSTFGGSADFFSRLALKKLGLTPAKDVALVQIGTGPDRLTAMEAGRIQGAMLLIPDSLIAQRRGYFNLAYVSMPSQGTGVATTRRFIRENPDLVRRIVKSQIDAVHRIKTDREGTVAALVKYFGSKDRDIMERTYDLQSSDDRLPPKQYPTLEGIKNILEPLAETDPKAKAAKPEEFVDVSFIRELDQSGYIDSLYKKR